MNELTASEARLLLESNRLGVTITVSAFPNGNDEVIIIESAYIIDKGTFDELKEQLKKVHTKKSKTVVEEIFVSDKIFTGVW